MFSTFCHRLSVQLWSRFSMFWQNTFKVVFSRIVVWGKGWSEKWYRSIMVRLSFLRNFTAFETKYMYLLKVVATLTIYCFSPQNLSVFGGEPTFPQPIIKTSFSQGLYSTYFKINNIDLSMSVWSLNLFKLNWNVCQNKVYLCAKVGSGLL